MMETLPKARLAGNEFRKVANSTGYRT